MRYTADQLIEQRKRKWEQKHDIEYDKALRLAIANRILEDADLLTEVRRYPEKLIELVFVVVDKEKKTKPFFLNEVQKEFIDILNQAIEDFKDDKITKISLLVLKGRQQGFTTLITAYQLACSIMNPNFEGFTLADESSNTEAIFQNKAKYPYSLMPDVLKPTEKFNNRRQLLFSKLNSSWTVDTATEDVGRSRTINFFHGSECAFWKCGIVPIQAALGQAFTRNCIQIYETTANGYNDYKTMWDSGEHINCFFPWWKTSEYRTKIPPIANMREDFLQNIQEKEEWVWERLRWLKNDIGLDEEQLYWYYKKYKGFIDKDKIKQEYPCTPDEAFLLSGKNAFNTEKLLARLASIPKPLKVGYFMYDYDGLRLTNIRWHPDRNGYIRIFAVPDSPAVTKYCIGGDTAGDGSDQFTAHVLDARTGAEVAAFDMEKGAAEYTRQMYCLGKYYKNALIGIEANFDSYPIMELERLGYDNQYVREAQDTYTGKKEKRFGFKTTQLTRPTAVSRLIEIVEQHPESIYDEATLRELLTIIKNEHGRVEAPEGGHDDHMMGLAIAHDIRSQVTFDEEAMQMNRQDEFHIQSEKSVRYEYEDRITVI